MTLDPSLTLAFENSNDFHVGMRMQGVLYPGAEVCIPTRTGVDP